MSTPDGAVEASAGEYSVDEDDQLQPEDTLIDRGVDDVLDEGYSPPERPYGRGSFGSTPESLDQLLAEEEPDPATRLYDPFAKGEQQRSDEAERETEFPQRNEVGRARAGRLVGPDHGFGEDVDADLLADDVGIDGGAASARRPPFTSSTMRSTWPRTRIQLENNSGWNTTYCPTVGAGSGGQIRVEWDGSSLVRWNHDPARLEAPLQLTGGAAV